MTTSLHPASSSRSSTWLSSALVSLMAVAAWCAAIDAQAAPGTWRLDFYVTEGPHEAIYSLDRFVVEPLPWPGPPAGRTDPSGQGVYRFEVRDSSRNVTYAGGFSPLFWEWTTTAEAVDRSRTFHESVRFPEPDQAVTVVFLKRDERGRFEEVWQVEANPDDIYVDRSAGAPEETIEFEKHGDPAEKVDLLLLGDGYTADECGAKFAADADRMISALFGYEPFQHRRRDFNIWGICPPARASGISRPSTGDHRSTPVGTTYDIFGSERYVLTYDNRSLREIAAWAPHDFIVILANSETYGGGGLYNVYATVTVGNDFADYLFVHEFGHHFAGLADEYYTSPAVYEPPAEILEPWEPNVTALLGGKPLKWMDLVTPDVPIPTPWPKDEYEDFMRGIQTRRTTIRQEERSENEMSELFREEQITTADLLSSARYAGSIGAFQGANYDAEAYYRPEIDCVMFTRNEVPFCRICQRAMEAVIDHHAGSE